MSNLTNIGPDEDDEDETEESVDKGEATHLVLHGKAGGRLEMNYHATVSDAKKDAAAIHSADPSKRVQVARVIGEMKPVQKADFVATRVRAKEKKPKAEPAAV